MYNTFFRTNVIETVTTEYFKTGSLWTYYDDVTGNGKVIVIQIECNPNWYYIHVGEDLYYDYNS